MLWILLAGLASADPWEAMDAAIATGGYGRIEAVLVQQGDQLLAERYYRRTTAETRLDARSAGKSITALAVGVAVDQGLLRVDDRVFDWLGDLAPFAHPDLEKADIRVRDLLSMSSALDCDDWAPSPGNEERMYRSRDWTRFAVDLPLDPAYVRDGAGQGRFSYCTAGVFLLGRVLERATGAPFDAYVDRVLFAPLGVEEPQWRRSPTGEVQSGGQLRMRARDYLAVGALVLDRGVHHGAPLVSLDWLRAMLTPHVRATPRDGYGYLWWVRDFRLHGEGPPHAGFYMSGNGGNLVVMFPDLDAVVVVLATNYNRRRMDQWSGELVERYALAALTAAGG